MKRSPSIGAAIAVWTLAAGAVSANPLFIGVGPAQSCYQSARDERASVAALAQCTLALREEVLSARDRAATHVNRGILHLERGAMNYAMADFDAATRLDPDMAEPYANRAQALLTQGDYRGAIEALNQSLERDPVEPEKSFYNRAIAYEELGDIPAAYRDYRRAAELAPTWEAARAELARFSVRPPN